MKIGKYTVKYCLYSKYLKVFYIKELDIGYNLNGILNTEIVNKLFTYCHSLTGLKTTLIDNNGKLLVPSQGQCKYCLLLSHKDGGAACRKSDKEAALIASENGKPHIYRCYAKLTDIIIPLFVKGDYVGAAMSGQVVTSNLKQKEITAIASKHNIPAGELIAAYKEVPYIEPEKLESMVKLLFEVLNYIIDVEVKRFDYLNMQDDQTLLREKIIVAENIIKKRYMENISMNQVAQEVGISRYYFSHLFKEKTGISFREYLNNERVVTARALLRDTDLNITTIAYDVGFDDSNYFSTVFKNFSGMTPRQYRRMHAGLDKIPADR